MGAVASVDSPTGKNNSLCPGCSIAFTLLKSKSQCTECYCYFCRDCLIKDTTGLKRCEDCHYLTFGKDLLRSKLTELRLRSLRQFLINRRISTIGCREKMDLIDVILRRFGGASHQSQQQQSRMHSDLLLERQRLMREESRGGLRDGVVDETIHPTAPPTPSSSTDQEQALAPPSYDDVLRSDPTSPVIASRDDRQQANTAQQLPHSNTGEQAPASSSIPVEESQAENMQSNTTRTTSDEPPPVSVAPSQQSSSGSPEYPSGSDSRQNQTNDKLSPRVLISEIRDEAAVDGLSIRQLCELLQQCCVDYKGCKEKVDLVERVKALWRERQNSSEINDSTPDDNLCKVCLDAPMDCVLLSCGHMVCCTPCARKLAECPICRQLISKVVHVFKA